MFSFFKCSYPLDEQNSSVTRIPFCLDPVALTSLGLDMQEALFYYNNLHYVFQVPLPPSLPLFPSLFFRPISIHLSQVYQEIPGKPKEPGCSQHSDPRRGVSIPRHFQSGRVINGGWCPTYRN